jgi:hypothetical protein
VLAVVLLAPGAGSASAAPGTQSAGPQTYASPSAGLAVRDDTPPAAVLAAPAPGGRAHGVRRPARPAAAAPAAGGPTAANATPLSASPAAPLAAETLVDFNGVSSRDSATTNFGAEFEPPDQGLCVGNGFVVEMVNSAYSVYDTSGNLLSGPFNVNAPFAEGLHEFTSDPRCYYDAATNTWFAVILGINAAENGSTLDVAVNPSGDPRTPWSAYKIDTTGRGGASGPKDPGCPCFGDQPTLGIDAHNIYVTTNEFSILGPQANGAELFAFAKRDLVALSPAVHFVRFAKLRLAGATAESVQPALTNGRSPAEFFLSALDPGLTFDNRIGVWALTEPAAVARGGVPTLSSVVLQSELYGFPPLAEQRGAPTPLETDDDHMQQTQYINGAIWGELSTALNLPGDPTQRAGTAWFEVKPTLASGAIGAAHIKQQGYVGVPGNYVLYPALQATGSASAAMVFTLSGSKRFPSAAYSVLAPGAEAFGPVSVAAPGTGRYDPEGERWGDYSWAVLDPGGEAVWLATEYVPPRASQTLDRVHNWGTRVFEVKP